MNELKIEKYYADFVFVFEIYSHESIVNELCAKVIESLTLSLH